MYKRVTAYPDGKIIYDCYDKVIVDKKDGLPIIKTKTLKDSNGFNIDRPNLWGDSPQYRLD